MLVCCVRGTPQLATLNQKQPKVGISGEWMTQHMRRSLRAWGTRKVRHVTRRRQRILDALGYIALLLLAALITYGWINQASRGPEPQITTSVGVEGASVQPAADR